MSEPILLRQDNDAIATLTMNSPKNLNALSDAMLAALQEQFDMLMNDRSIRAVILRGSGKDVSCTVVCGWCVTLEQLS